MTLLMEALARFSLLTRYVKDLRVRLERQGQGLIYRLTEHDVKAFMIMDEVMIFSSDENIMAMYKHTSSHHLHHVSSVLLLAHPSRSSLDDATSARNPLEADFALALSGNTASAALAKGSARSPPQQLLRKWDSMLQVAGTQLSVRAESSHHTCVD